MLVVGPFADKAALQSLLPQMWALSWAAELRSALKQMQAPGAAFPIIICDSELAPDSWREMVDRVRCIPAAPLLIVASRLADERLWAEALNVGAYDVLAKPFDCDEVNRVLSSAFLRWSRSLPAVVRQPLRPAALTA